MRNNTPTSNKSNNYIQIQFLNMKKGLLSLFAVFLSLLSIAATITSTTTGGTWSVGGSWVGGVAPGAGDDVIIVGTATVTVSGASITRNSGTTLTIQSGGTLINSNGITMNGTMSVASGATYRHSLNGGTIPAATWAAGSNCLVTGTQGTAPGGLAQSFSNFTWNCTGQSSAIGLAGNLATINGNLTITSSNSQQVRFASTQSPNVTVGGNLSITGGLLVLNSGNGSATLTVTGSTTISSGSLIGSSANNTGTPVINFNGDLTISGGTLDYQNAGNTTCLAIVNLAGNFTMSAGTITKTSTAATARPFNFNKVGTQTFTKTGGTISCTTGPIDFNVNSGSTLDFGTSILNGTGPTFTASSGSGLITKNTAGFSTSAATGTVQVTGTKTYSTGADYSYNGTAAQVMGNGFTGARNLTINNTSGATPAVTFIVNATISGDFTVTAGDIRNTSGTGRTITMTGAAPTLTVGGSITGTNIGGGNDLNLTYTNTSGTLLINGGGSLCRFLNVTNTNVGSTIALERTLEVMFGTFTETGTLQINAGGAISTAGSAVAPTYGSSSTLVYNSGGSYGVAGEWTGAGVTVGLGVPQDIIIQNNTTVTASASRGFAGDMLVDAGSVFATGGTLATGGSALIDGSFQLNSGGFATGSFIYAATNSKLIFNTAYTVAGGHAYFPATDGPAKVFVNAGTVDFGSVTRTIPDSFSVSATISNYCNLTLNGVTALNSGYNFSGSCGAGLPVYACNSTLNYNSGGTPSRGGEWGSGTTPGNIAISNNTTFNGNTGSATICGDLTVAAGSSLYMDFGGSGASALNVGGNVTLAGNLSLGFGVGGDMTVGGNWTHTTGTFNTNSRLVTFNGASGNQTITNAGGETFAFLTVNKASGNVVLGGNVTVNNTLALTSGDLSIGANTLTLAAAFSRTSGNLAGGNTSNLTVNGTAGSLYFTSGGTNDYLRAFTIGASGSATLATALNIAAYDGVSAEGVVAVASGGSLTTGGLLTLKSDNNGTARIASNTSGGTYISGDVTVERYIRLNSSKAWRLLASNTSGQSINASWQEGQSNSLSNSNAGFGTQISAGNTITTNLATAQTAGFDTLSAGVALFKYNPATDGLNAVTNTTSTGLASEPGYFIFIRGDRRVGGYGGGTTPTAATVLRSKGSVFQGTQTTATGAQNFGLVRNPFASRIDLTAVTFESNVTPAVQVWDPKIGGAFGVGGYQTLTKSGADFLITPGGGSYGGAASVQNFIESGAAFFIQSSTNVSNNSIIIPEGAKATGSSPASFRPATPAAGEGRLSFTLSADNAGSFDIVDGGLAFFNNDFSNAVDVNDVRKSFNFNENFGMKRENVDLVVERRQQANINDTIFFNIGQMKPIAYRLDIEAVNIDPLITTAILEDKYTNIPTAIDLSVPNAYSFTVNADAASKAADRFRLVFRQSTVVPVNFVSVKAAQSGKNIAVEWIVANEVNTKYYEVEKSIDSRNFIAKGTVQASGINTYNWLDENAVNGYNYYRIKSVDNNGQVKYSGVVKVQVGGKAGMAVYPNPIQGNIVNLQFNNQQAGKYGIRITNIGGQAVYNKEVTHNGGSASQSFALSSQIVTGVYQLEIIAPDNSRHIEKLVINKGN